MPLSSRARNARTARCWNFLYLGGFKIGGNEEFCAFFEIFGGVIVELAVGDDFAGDGGLGIVIAEDGDFDFAGVDGALDENFHGEFGGEIQRGSRVPGASGLWSCRRSSRAWRASRKRIGDFFFDLMLDDVFVAFPLVAMDAEPGDYGNFRGLKEFFGDVFVHGDWRSLGRLRQQTAGRLDRAGLGWCRLRRRCRA